MSNEVSDVVVPGCCNVLVVVNEEPVDVDVADVAEGGLRRCDFCYGDFREADLTFCHRSHGRMCEDCGDFDECAWPGCENRLSSLTGRAHCLDHAEGDDEEEMKQLKQEEEDTVLEETVRSNASFKYDRANGRGRNIDGEDYFVMGYWKVSDNGGGVDHITHTLPQLGAGEVRMELA